MTRCVIILYDAARHIVKSMTQFTGVKPMDTETVPDEPKDKNEKEHITFFDISRKIILASVGAIAVAQDELEEFINRLIERGEIAEKDGRKLLVEMKEKRKKRSHEVEEEIGKKVRDTMERMNIPTRGDFEKLTDTIAVLSKKIDDLAKTKK
jgi:poly(hydroxyalkanoate) granule-associated protein